MTETIPNDVHLVLLYPGLYIRKRGKTPNDDIYIENPLSSRCDPHFWCLAKDVDCWINKINKGV